LTWQLLDAGAVALEAGTRVSSIRRWSSSTMFLVISLSIFLFACLSVRTGSVLCEHIQQWRRIRMMKIQFRFPDMGGSSDVNDVVPLSLKCFFFMFGYASWPLLVIMAVSLNMSSINNYLHLVEYENPFFSYQSVLFCLFRYWIGTYTQSDLAQPTRLENGSYRVSPYPNKSHWKKTKAAWRCSLIFFLFFLGCFVHQCRVGTVQHF
jgi:hypothetical protein